MSWTISTQLSNMLGIVRVVNNKLVSSDQKRSSLACGPMQLFTSCLLQLQRWPVCIKADKWPLSCLKEGLAEHEGEASSRLIWLIQNLLTKALIIFPLIFASFCSCLVREQSPLAPYLSHRFILLWHSVSNAGSFCFTSSTKFSTTARAWFSVKPDTQNFHNNDSLFLANCFWAWKSCIYLTESDLKPRAWALLLADKAINSMLENQCSWTPKIVNTIIINTVQNRAINILE